MIRKNKRGELLSIINKKLKINEKIIEERNYLINLYCKILWEEVMTSDERYVWNREAKYLRYNYTCSFSIMDSNCIDYIFNKYSKDEEFYSFLNSIHGDCTYINSNEITYEFFNITIYDYYSKTFKYKRVIIPNIVLNINDKFLNNKGLFIHYGFVAGSEKIEINKDLEQEYITRSKCYIDLISQKIFQLYKFYILFCNSEITLEILNENFSNLFENLLQ